MGSGGSSGFRRSWSWVQPLPWGAEPWQGGEDGRLWTEAQLC